MSKVPNILIIEDQCEIQQIFADLLSILGPMNFYFADTSAKAIDLLKENGESIDLILCDYAMPGGNGSAVIQFNHRHLQRPLFLVTGGYMDSLEGLEGISFSEGKYKFITKPFDESQFLQKVQEALGSK